MNGDWLHVATWLLIGGCLLTGVANVLYIGKPIQRTPTSALVSLVIVGLEVWVIWMLGQKAGVL